jgi:hypothetical protein
MKIRPSEKKQSKYTILIFFILYRKIGLNDQRIVVYFLAGPRDVSGNESEQCWRVGIFL